MAYLKALYEERPLTEGQSPLSFYRRLKGRYSFLIESGDINSCYSYIGYDPFLLAGARDDLTEALILKNEFGLENRQKKQIMDVQPTEAIKTLQRRFELKGSQPLPFCGGLAGYYSYDFLAGNGGFRQSVHNDLGIPDLLFLAVDKLLVFDRGKRTLILAALAETEISCERKLEEMKNDLEKPEPFRRLEEIGEVRPSLSREQFEAKMKQAEKAHWDNNGVPLFSVRLSAEHNGDLCNAYARMGKDAVSDQIYSSALFDFDDFSFAAQMVVWKEKDAEKEAAMALTDRLEDYRRGVFGGRLSLNGFNGHAENYCIQRSLSLKDNRIYLQEPVFFRPGEQHGKIYDQIMEKSALNLQIDTD